MVWKIDEWRQGGTQILHLGKVLDKLFFDYLKITILQHSGSVILWFQKLKPKKYILRTLLLGSQKNNQTGTKY